MIFRAVTYDEKMKCPASKSLKSPTLKWVFPREMTMSNLESKSKPAKKGTRISSADALAKGAGTELSENELKRVSGGVKLDYKE